MTIQHSTLHIYMEQLRRNGSITHKPRTTNTHPGVNSPISFKEMKSVVKNLGEGGSQRVNTRNKQFMRFKCGTVLRSVMKSPADSAPNPRESSVCPVLKGCWDCQYLQSHSCRLRYHTVVDVLQYFCARNPYFT